MEIHNTQINAERTKQKQHRHETTKLQTNTFSKYCKDNAKSLT